MIKDIQAFPVPDSDFELGMTLRDYFAGMAMQSLILAAKTSQDVDLLSKGAYQLADAMLKERSK